MRGKKVRLKKEKRDHLLGQMGNLWPRAKVHLKMVKEVHQLVLTVNHYHLVKEVPQLVLTVNHWLEILVQEVHQLDLMESHYHLVQEAHLLDLMVSHFLLEILVLVVQPLNKMLQQERLLRQL